MKISLRDKKISQWNIILFLRDKIISRWNIILFLRDKIIYPWNMKIQYFLMWFKNGLKAQKLLAQGSALGIITFSARRPVRAKALLIAWF